MLRAEQEGFAVLEVDVGLGDLRLAGAHGFDFPALEHEPGFEAFLDEIVVARPAVLGDEPRRFLLVRLVLVAVMVVRPALYPCDPCLI